MKASKSRSFLILSLIVAFFAFRCDENKEGLQVQFEQVDFQFRLLNENGAPATIFNQGENFTFSFLMINSSDQDFYFKQSSLDRIGFLEVFNTTGASLGKPYEGLFCLERNGILVPANDTLKLEIEWIPSASCCPPNGQIFCGTEDTVPLPPGSYRTSFKSAFEFFFADQSYTTSLQDFMIEFEIQ